jgi:hypothetical protein
MADHPLKSFWAKCALVVLVVGMFLAGWFGKGGFSWLFVAVLMAAFMAVVGLYVMGRPTGVLINERNLMSLSRFQMVLWSIIVLSAYFTMVVARIKQCDPNPLSIQIDWHLLALMGISATSLLGAPLIQSTKATKQPQDAAVTKTANLLGQQHDEVNSDRQGILYVNHTPADAQLADMFEGDELSNTASVDLGKVQMFFFTVIVAFSYSVILFNNLANAPCNPDLLKGFPILSDGLVALLGISHAGYLTTKATDHTVST